MIIDWMSQIYIDLSLRYLYNVTSVRKKVNIVGTILLDNEISFLIILSYKGYELKSVSIWIESSVWHWFEEILIEIYSTDSFYVTECNWGTKGESTQYKKTQDLMT